jgi:hypothetical protein
VETVLTDDTLARLKRKDPDDKAQAKTVTSKRYFKVRIKDPPVEVSDVLYVGYTDGTFYVPLCMQHRPPLKPETAAEVLWPAMIEKAFAVENGDYETLDVYGPGGKPVDAYWTPIVGSAPRRSVVDKNTSDKDIRSIAQAAAATPTPAASKTGAAAIDEEHGFAVRGMHGNRVRLYDPHGKTVTVSFADFRASFEMIYRKP